MRYNVGKDDLFESPDITTLLIKRIRFAAPKYKRTQKLAYLIGIAC